MMIIIFSQTMYIASLFSSRTCIHSPSRIFLASDVAFLPIGTEKFIGSCPIHHFGWPCVQLTIQFTLMLRMTDKQFDYPSLNLPLDPLMLKSRISNPIEPRIKSTNRVFFPCLEFAEMTKLQSHWLIPHCTKDLQTGHELTMICQSAKYVWSF